MTSKKPIHVAGILSGYITVNLTSAQLGHPALVGLAPEQVPGLAESTLTAKAGGLIANKHCNPDRSMTY